MKGSVIMLAFVIIIVFLIGLSTFIGYLFLSSFQGTQLDGTILNQGINAIKLFDYLTIGALVASAIGTVLSALFIRTHPSLFIFSMLITIFLAIFASQISNVFLQFADSTIFSSISSYFKNTVSTFQNLPSYILIIGILGAIGLYAFRNRGGEMGI